MEWIEIFQKINWNSFFTTLCGAGFGAFAAYCLNKHFEKCKILNNQKLKFLQILNSAYYLNDYFIAFKLKTLPPFINCLKNKTQENKNFPYIQTVFVFDITINDYLFLFEKNLNIFHLLKKIESEITILNNDILNLNNLSSNGFSFHKPLVDKTIDDVDNLINLTDILFNSLLNNPNKNFSKFVDIKKYLAYQEKEKQDAIQLAKQNPNLLKGWEGALTSWNT